MVAETDEGAALVDDNDREAPSQFSFAIGLKVVRNNERNCLRPRSPSAQPGDAPVAETRARLLLRESEQRESL
jgi:hypothetical protein